MNNNDEKIFEIMNEALKLKDEGKTIPEILDGYPEYRKELEEMFSTINFLNQEKEKIAAPQDVLRKIVTNEEISRYLERGGEYKEKIRMGAFGLPKPQAEARYSDAKGRASEILSQITNRMTNRWKIFVPVGIVALAIIALAIYSQLGKETPQVAQEQEGAEQQVAVVPATGNVDDAINALVQAATADQAASNQEEGDISLLLADSQAIGDFGQSYNESEF
jgi:hypothetical protein